MWINYIMLFTLVGADFAVIGDWGRRGTHSQRNVANILNAQNPDYVVSVGDNFYSSGIESASDPRAHLWVEVYNASVPWYVCLGNHDYVGNAAAQVDMSRIYKQWIMPKRFFNIKHKDTELFFIDTTPWIDENYLRHHFGEQYGIGDGPWVDFEYQKTRIYEQKEWLTSALEQSVASRKFIVGHHPLWTFGIHHQQTGDMYDFLKNVMVYYNIDAYLCGHDHNMQHIISEEGIHEYVSGAGASSYPIENVQDETLIFSAGEKGFLMVRDSGEFEFINSSGDIIYTFK